MKFNGSAKQQKWAEEILNSASLSDIQIDNLLRWAGPKMYEAGIMDSTIVIDNRKNLNGYADSLGKFLKMSSEEKHSVAVEAAWVISGVIK